MLRCTEPDNHDIVTAIYQLDLICYNAYADSALHNEESSNRSYIIMHRSSVEASSLITITMHHRHRHYHHNHHHHPRLKRGGAGLGYSQVNEPGCQKLDTYK